MICYEGVLTFVWSDICLAILNVRRVRFSGTSGSVIIDKRFDNQYFVFVVMCVWRLLVDWTFLKNIKLGGERGMIRLSNVLIGGIWIN